MWPLAPLGLDSTAGFYRGRNPARGARSVAGNLVRVKISDRVKLPPFVLDGRAAWWVSFQTIGAVGAGAVGLGLIAV